MSLNINFSNDNIGKRNKYIALGALVLSLVIIGIIAICLLKKYCTKKKSTNQNLNQTPQQNQNSNRNNKGAPNTIAVPGVVPPAPPPLLQTSNNATTNMSTNKETFVPNSKINSIPNPPILPAQQSQGSAPKNRYTPQIDLTQRPTLRKVTGVQFDKTTVNQAIVKKYFEENLICSKNNKKNAIKKKLGIGGVHLSGITAISDFSYQTNDENTENISFKATICEDLNSGISKSQEVEFLFKINDQNSLKLLNENEVDNSDNKSAINTLKKSMINYKNEISNIIISRWDNFVKDYKDPNASLIHNDTSGLNVNAISGSGSDSEL